MLASHALDEFDVIEFSSSTCTDAFVRAMPAPSVSEGRRLAGEAESRSGTKSEGIRCARGFLIALGFEAAMVFCVYGIWHVWHIVR
jgi:hypothetical protein